jgi:hypothetical protein
MELLPSKVFKNDSGDLIKKGVEFFTFDFSPQFVWRWPRKGLCLGDE